MPPVSAEPFDAIGASVQRSSDGQSAARVADYLEVHASGGPWAGAGGDYSHPPGLVRFASPPAVRLTTGMTERERAIALYGVALVNRALPYGQHLRTGPDAPSVVAQDGGDLAGKVPDGEVFIEFHRARVSGRASPAVAHQDVSLTHDDNQGRWEKKRLRASQVEIDAEYFDSQPDHVAVSVLVHELLHAIGLQGHVPGQRFSDSNMYNAWFRLDGSLPAIDMAAVQVLYTRLGEETEPEELSAMSFGSWSREIVHLAGELDGTTFGVRHSNGISTPWTAGTEPSRALADNPRLSGTATWSGGLLGFTPALVPVGGNAELSVDLATMNGNADFTELQSWSAGSAPGALGSGETWNTGSLRYTITVGGNYLRSIGGDDGTVNGQFYGPDHEGVAGSLEREDLTAAFGGKR